MFGNLTSLANVKAWLQIGQSAFPPGSRSFREQVRRLAGEGVLVVRGRVDLSRHGWERNLDAALWAPPSPTVKKSVSGTRKRASSRKKP